MMMVKMKRLKAVHKGRREGTENTEIILNALYVLCAFSVFSVNRCLSCLTKLRV